VVSPDQIGLMLQPSLLAMEEEKHGICGYKACSHNPNEVEICVQAAKKYGKVIQMEKTRRAHGPM